MNNIQIKRGNGEPPQLLEGELGYSLDTEKLYIGKSNQSGNTVFESSQSINNQFSEINEKIDNHIIVNNLNNSNIVKIPTIKTIRLNEDKTGKLIIKLPQTNKGLYIMCNIKIYDYGKDTVCTYTIGNSFLPSTLTWGGENINAASCSGNGELSGLPVTFGTYNSNIPIITIGDSTSTWSNGCLIVIDDLIGSIQYYDYFSQDWDISIDTDITLTGSYIFNTAKRVLLFSGAVKTGNIKLADDVRNYNQLVFRHHSTTTGTGFGSAKVAFTKLNYIEPLLFSDISPDNTTNNRHTTYVGRGYFTDYYTFYLDHGIFNVVHTSKSNHGGGTQYYVREVWGIK